MVKCLFIATYVLLILVGRTYAQTLIPVQRGDYWGYINPQGEWVINPQFYDVEKFEDGLAKVKIRGRTVGRPGFKLGRSLNKTDIWCGVIDETGKYVIPPNYNRMSNFCNGFCEVEIFVYDSIRQQDLTSYAIIDKTGKYIIPPSYNSMSISCCDEMCEVRSSFYDSIQRKYVNSYGIIDKNGNYKPKPEGFICSNSYKLPCNVVEYGDSVIIYDNCGNVIKSLLCSKNGKRFEDLNDGFTGITYYNGDKNSKICIIDSVGDIIIDGLGYACPYSEGLAAVCYDYREVFFIDKKGNIVIDKMPCEVGGYGFHEGVVVLADRNEKRAFLMDKTGNIVLYRLIGDRFEYFRDGIMPVEIHSKYGFINKSGKFVIPPIYDGVIW